MTVIAFAMMASVAGGFAFATLAREGNFQLPGPTQTGDTSLGRRSVIWLGATALIIAVWICFVLI